MTPGNKRRPPLPRNPAADQAPIERYSSIGPSPKQWPDTTSILERTDAAQTAQETALLAAFVNNDKRTRELIAGLPVAACEFVGRHRTALALALTAPPAALNVVTLRGRLQELGHTEAAAGLIMDDDLTAPTVEGSGHSAREIVRLHGERLRYRAGQLLVEGQSVRAKQLLSEADQLESSLEYHRDDGRSLADFARMEIDPAETLLGHRYLCRGGSMLFVGPSGIGKSSASCQQDMLWALGRVAFGIRPARPLRILAFQAENDDGDQHEMAAGVATGMDLDAADMDIIHANTRYLTRFETGHRFISTMAKEVEQWKPDLVRIDPLNAFIGDDVKETRAIAEFCRAGINPILHRFRCGCVVAHHTPKTNFRDTSNWSPLDWAYAAAGGADLTNWARAVMVVDPVCLDTGIFRFIGAKRGARAGWRNEDDEVEINRFFAYSKDHSNIYWRDADSSEVLVARRTEKKAPKTPDDLLALVPQAGELVGKATLLEEATHKLAIGQKKAIDLLRVLMEKRAIHEHHEKRSSKRDAILIGRHAPAQSTEDAA
jgi:hypothetical protein